MLPFKHLGRIDPPVPQLAGRSAEFRAASRMNARLGLDLQVVLERAVVAARSTQQPLRLARAPRTAPR